MADIYHDFIIRASAEKVLEGFTTPAGLDRWWTKDSAGMPLAGTEYRLGFGPEYDWRAQVSHVTAGQTFELLMTRSDKDWQGTKVRVDVKQHENHTAVRFSHKGWPEANEHFRITSFCWSMYLRLLKRYLEYGEVVPYEKRLDV